jgi:hypothetical protein
MPYIYVTYDILYTTGPVCICVYVYTGHRISEYMEIKWPADWTHPGEWCIHVLFYGRGYVHTSVALSL